MYKVLITTSGTGSRLKELTKTTNKSLIKINGKTVISYIIESYPNKVPLVITIGYYGELVKEFVCKTYSDRDITFVKIDNFDGVGSSLGYSMLNAKRYLQLPFIFHCNDTIVLNTTIPSPEDYNWNGGAKGNDPKLFNTKHYSSFTIQDDIIQTLQPKGAKEYDLFHIGLTGIKDYRTFWKYLEEAYKEDPKDSTLNDVISLSKMIENGYAIKPVKFENWYDIGNPSAFTNAKKHLR